ncbi:MAG: DoxX family protein [Propionibacteriaceae bacterium]
MLTLAALPQPIWPVVVLAVIQFADGLICIKPVAFVAQCLTDVAWPREFWPATTVVKFVASAALVAGIWVPYLGLAAALGVIAYFVVAIAMHLRAKDFSRNLFVNALGMLVISMAATTLSYVGHLPAA